MLNQIFLYQSQKVEWLTKNIQNIPENPKKWVSENAGIMVFSFVRDFETKPKWIRAPGQIRLL